MKYILAIGLFALLALGLACGDDDAEPTPDPTDPPTLEPGRRADAIEALRTYLQNEGLDGETGTLTNPVECENLPEGDVEGDFCIVEPGVYAPALALIFVGAIEDPMNEAWQVREVLEDGEWRVIETVKLDE